MHATQIIKKVKCRTYISHKAQTSANWSLEMISKFGRSPWSAASLFKVDNSFAALPTTVAEEAIKIVFFNRTECTVFDTAFSLYSSPMWSRWSCFPAYKIAWITTMNCNGQSFKICQQKLQERGSKWLWLKKTGFWLNMFHYHNQVRKFRIIWHPLIWTCNLSICKQSKNSSLSLYFKFVNEGFFK